MKKTILGLGLILALGTVSFAQKANTTASAATSGGASIKKGDGNLGLEGNTQIAAELQNSIDVQKAKIGDQVVVRTTRAIKQNGKTIVDKGSRMYGRVTEVQQKSKASAASHVGILFDRVEQGKNQFPISAMITSISQAHAQMSAGDEDMSTDMSSRSSSTASTRSSGGGSGGGGLLGGVGSAVGNVVNTTGQTVGGVVNTAGQTVGSTTQTVGGTLKGIQISQSSSASAQGGSTLSLQNGNIHLDKGTTFNLSLSESASVKGN